MRVLDGGVDAPHADLEALAGDGQVEVVDRLERERLAGGIGEVVEVAELGEQIGDRPLVANVDGGALLV